MPKPLPEALRKRIIDTFLEDEQDIEQIAARFRVGVSTTYRIIADYQKDGRCAPKPHTGGRSHRKMHTEHRQALVQWLEDEPSLTQLELAQKLEQHFGLSVCQATVSNALRDANWTFKKNHSR